MSSTLTAPADVATLTALLAERDAALSAREMLLAQRDALIAAREERVAELEQQVAQLKRMLFGPRSERRRADDPGQGQFLFPELAAQAQAVADATGATGVIEVTVPAHTRRKGGRRATFPDHLPVVRTTYELPEAQRQCCGQTMVEIGHETRQELERIEITLRHEIARTKYACRACQVRLLTAPGPAQVIDKGLLGTGFLAHLITERFARHLPYYRLEQKYADEGLSLSRSVLCRSALRCAELLEPIRDALLEEILEAPVIQLDDTPVTIQRGSTDGRKTGHAWVYGDTAGRAVFDLTESRSRDGPLAMLKGYRGYVQADAYSGHDALFTDGTRIEVGCWAHARRYFEKARDTERGLADQAIDRIRKLYAIERQAKDLSDDERRALRQSEVVPVLAELRTWIEAARPMVLPKSPLAAALHYALAQWDALQRYTTDGRLPIDNNGAERALRPIAVGRKNWLFVGHEEAGQKDAVLFSLVTTCRAIGVEPRAYLRDVLLRIATCTDARELTPHAWQRQHLAQAYTRELELLARLPAATAAP